MRLHRLYLHGIFGQAGRNSGGSWADSHVRHSSPLQTGLFGEEPAAKAESPKRVARPKALPKTSVAPEAVEVPKARPRAKQVARRGDLRLAPGMVFDRLTALGWCDYASVGGELRWYFQCQCNRIEVLDPYEVAEWAAEGFGHCNACFWPTAKVAVVTAKVAVVKPEPEDDGE